MPCSDVVDYAIKSIDKAMSVDTYTHFNSVPDNMKDFLPDAAALSQMLS